MTNLELQEGIVQNLLLGLKKQSEAYLDLISNAEYTHEQRKDFEKELSDINKVLNELSGKTISYTVSELELLKTQFNDRLTQLNSIITNLEINTLKIEFDSLTPEQKAFLKGEKGDKGDKGENSYELAVRYGFVGNEIEYLNSLKGKDGVNGVNGINGTNGQNGLSAYELAANNGFTGTLSEWLESLKGADGQDAESPIFDFDNLDTIQKEKISTYLFNLTQFTDLLQRLTNLESNSTGGENPTPETPTTDNNSLFINIPADSNSYDYKLSYTPQLGDIIEINATLEDGTVLKEDGSIVDYEGNLIFSSNWTYEYPTDLQPAFNVNPGSNFLFINNDISDSQGNKLSISQQLEVILIRNETKIKLELLEFTTDRTVSDSWWQ